MINLTRRWQLRTTGFLAGALVLWLLALPVQEALHQHAPDERVSHCLQCKLAPDLAAAQSPIVNHSSQTSIGATVASVAVVVVALPLPPARGPPQRS